MAKKKVSKNQIHKWTFFIAVLALGVALAGLFLPSDSLSNDALAGEAVISGVLNDEIVIDTENKKSGGVYTPVTRSEIDWSRLYQETIRGHKACTASEEGQDREVTTACNNIDSTFSGVPTEQRVIQEECSEETIESTGGSDRLDDYFLSCTCKEIEYCKCRSQPSANGKGTVRTCNWEPVSSAPLELVPGSCSCSSINIGGGDGDPLETLPDQGDVEQG